MASAPLPRSTSPDDAYGEAPPLVAEGHESRGSSVSSRLQEEYDNVLKSAVIMPNVENIPAIVEQFLGQVAREVDTYPPGHAFSSARLVDVSDDENPRPTKPPQTKKDQPTNLMDAPNGTGDFIDIIGKELSTTNTSSEHHEERGQQDCKQGESKIFFGSNSHLQSETTTSSNSDTIPRGLPKSRFVPEKEPPTQPVVTKSSFRPNQGSKPLFYTAPPRIQPNLTDVSGNSALDQLANTGGDSDLVRTENLLDQWSGELKRNILAEFGQAKCRIAGNFHHLLNKEKERHVSELRSHREEVDSVRELLATYELSLTRKDQVISNLTQSLHRHRDRLEMQKRFAEWRQQHADRKREAFCSKLAAQHYERTLYRQIWNAWHSLLVGKWRHRVERACQVKAQEVCLQLTNDYEAKIASLNEALEASRNEVQRLHREREWYEENMKKAFMRGVCALNMEALGMFRPPENDQDAEDNDTPSEVEVSATGPGNNGPIPFYGMTTSETAAAPVYTVTTAPKLTTPGGRKSGAENIQPQKILRAHMIARDKPLSSTAPLSNRPLGENAAKQRTSAISPSGKPSLVRPLSAVIIDNDPKKVHFAHHTTKN